MSRNIVWGVCLVVVALLSSSSVFAQAPAAALAVAPPHVDPSGGASDARPRRAERPGGSALAPGASLGITPYAVLFAGATLDGITTRNALQHPNLAEGGPLQFAGGTTGLLAVKAAGTGFLAWTMHRMAKAGHPTMGRVLGYSLGAAWSGIAINNARLTKRYSR